MNATFVKSVGYLETAYIKGVLEPLSTAACAGGNILAGYNNFRVVSDSTVFLNSMGFGWVHENGAPVELHEASTGLWRCLGQDDIDGKPYLDAYEQAIADAVGYTHVQWRAIENAFMFTVDNSEMGYHLITPEETFAALLRVVDVLADIHGVELETAKEAKRLFASITV